MAGKCGTNRKTNLQSCAGLTQAQAQAKAKTGNFNCGSTRNGKWVCSELKKSGTGGWLGKRRIAGKGGRRK